MMSMVLGLSLLVVGLTVAGQLLLKYGAIRTQGGKLINRYVAIGYILFLLVVFASWFLMRVIDLKYFAALMSANYMAVALASRLVLKEKIGRRRAIGTLITAAGVLIFIMS